ncbi:heat shock protein [Longilinea arvoryzae]|uniref:Heat shock protein n=1 Tax=Longilinea arvoryzae TaxID=360412 RepID=A0A0S7BIN9_9CHLR|nr:META domain-containing protein [Longilinea arvoryzae]GAP13729.1 heat shock protein [Longilinea arvoryzae]
MKKIILMTWLCIAAFGLSGCGVASNGNTENPTATAPTEIAEPSSTIPPTSDHPAYQNATYIIEGQSITLVDGRSEIEAAPGSASKIVTQYFGNEAFGDLNGDGKEDVVFLVTQNSGGSGTFFYVVAALQTETGYQGTNAVLLGDRIAPQTTAIENGRIVVNYTDRKPDDPFTTQPSVGVSKYIKVVDGNQVEVVDPSQFTKREWKWVETQLNDGTITTPVEASSYTIIFNEDGTLVGKTDCNNYSGKYNLVDNKLSLSDISVSVEKVCEGSQETEFIKSLGEIGSLLLNGVENKLVLLVKYDSGSMVFE